ncbi:hypothetical protein EDC90_102720 [Martelella mediterranea]|uniref:Uncharacterized protein n=1 Tax=Martelella mediterranea TaxID=293089 RepID=A0A4R3NR18_9HYPH|nr:hypothetical protein EDC90_102720 [Martelella mediterranea]
MPTIMRTSIVREAKAEANLLSFRPYIRYCLTA